MKRDLFIVVALRIIGGLALIGTALVAIEAATANSWQTAGVAFHYLVAGVVLFAVAKVVDLLLKISQK